MANRSGHPPEMQDVVTDTTARTLVAADSGKLFIAGAVDLVYTLPAATPALKGVKYKFVVSTPSATTGLSLSPDSADKIQGKGITAADDKDLINTAATDAVGDSVELVCDGVDGWWITSMLGTWARQA
jgi:hypothetical protein